MDAMLDELKTESDITLCVASVGNVQSPSQCVIENIKYYCVPNDKNKIYRYKKQKNRTYWQAIVNDCRPDIIMIWGTEYAHGRCVLEIAKGIPSVIFLQGLLSSIEKYYLGGMSIRELIHAYTVRNFIKHDSIIAQQCLYRKKAMIEKEMLLMAENVIVDNRWAVCNCKIINPKCEIYFCQLKTKKVFLESEWDIKKCKPHQIFCTAPVGYPLKGFHNAIKALRIVCDQYPDAVLRVPGMYSPFNVSKLGKLKHTGYIRYVADLIQKNNLKSNIQFLGPLTSEQVAWELQQANLYMVTSCIENHSISLREAMAVGTPCIVSYAGGMPEIIRDGENGRLYRYEEYGQLANLVIDFFASDPTSLMEMSEAARSGIRRYYKNGSAADELLKIYGQIIGKMR
jgi:glycosyltransferase involved in cell wall biosynthesis